MKRKDSNGKLLMQSQSGRRRGDLSGSLAGPLSGERNRGVIRKGPPSNSLPMIAAGEHKGNIIVRRWIECLNILCCPGLRVGTTHLAACADQIWTRPFLG